MTTPGSPRLSKAMAAPGYLAIWVSLHVAAGVFCAADLAGLDARWEVFLVAFGSTLGAYTLDRVKIKDAWDDPADREADPARERFLRKRSGLLRIMSGGAIAAAAAAGWRVHPAAAALPIVSVLGATVYATRRLVSGSGRGRSRRAIKDRFIVKNLAVALAVASLAAALLLLDQWNEARGVGDRAPVGAIIAACAFLAGQVFGDAALCDIPDIESDREHGTQTIAGRHGLGAAWGIALAINAALAAGAWGASTLGLLSEPAWWRWSALLFIGTGLLGLAPRRSIRDLADLRIPAAGAVILVWGSI